MLRTVNVLQSVMEGDWFVIVDLKDAYFHVPIFIIFIFMFHVHDCLCLRTTTLETVKKF